MSTAEAGVRASESPVGVLYDGFLSYSHAADDLLAPRLQAGLQRFAKPWWKRRALRIFRDDASLSANPHLWSSITDALDESGWFVLLLSPDAAASEWVNREVEYWLSHKEASRIVPVVTEGEFTWADRDISPDTTAAPPALYGAFSEEPRWVDLRWARTDTDLDLRNTQFRAAVADIASAIRGVPKDELASEEVKQHRRTIRMAWAAGISVATLALLAVVAAVYAVGKGNEAEAQARISLSRELAASAISQLDRDSELSLLLALQAAEVSRAVDGRVLREAEEALHAALQRFRLELTLPETGRGEFTADGRSFVAADPISYGDYVGTGSTSGRHRFAREMDGEVVLWDGESGERIAGWPADARGVVDLALSPDGALLATTGDDGVKVWDMAARTEKYPPLSLLGPITPVFSPDGRYLAATSILGRVNVWDVATGDTVQSIPHPGLRPAVRAAIQGIAFSSDGSVLAVGNLDAVLLYGVETWQVVETLIGHAGEVCDLSAAPTADLLLTGSQDGTAVLWDLASREPVRQFTGQAGPVCAVDFGPGGDRLATGSQDGTARIWSVETGLLELELTSSEAVEHVAFNPEGTSIVTAHAGGTSRIWNISPQGGGEVLAISGPRPAQSVAFGAPGRVGTRGVLETGGVRVWDLSDGSELLALSSPAGEGRIAFNSDGSLLAGPGPGAVPTVWDAYTGDQRHILTFRDFEVLGYGFSQDGHWLVTADTNGQVRLWNMETGEQRTPPHRGFGRGPLYGWVQHTSRIPVHTAIFSFDDTSILSASSDGAAQLSELVTGRRLQAYPHEAPVLAAAFSPDGSLVATASQDGTAVIWNAATADRLLTLTVGLPVIDVAFTADGSRLATGSRDGAVRLWDSVTGEELLTLQSHAASVTDIDFSHDGLYLATAGMDGTVQVLLLDVGQLIELAESRVTRSLTDVECQRYLHLEACPDGT